jgi:hypothetical protein
MNVLHAALGEMNSQALALMREGGKTSKPGDFGE